jgi:type I restriction enzyme, S subunit
MNNELKPYAEYKDSGVEWIGKIPSHWHIYKNSVLFREVVDTNHPDLELLSIMLDRGIVKQSSTGRKNRMSEDNKTYKRICVGDIGYNLMNAFMGSIGVSKYEGIISPAYAVCRPKVQLNSWYYHYLFKTPLYKSEFNKNSYGIMYERNRLYFDRFKRIFTFMPTLEEQNQIVNYLDFKLTKINKFIKAKKKLIEVLKEQKQVSINKAVTNGINSNVKMKPSGIEWFGDIPEHWEVLKLSQIAKITLSGLDKKSYDNQKEVLLCNYVDVYKNDYITPNIDFMKATASNDEIYNLTLKSEDIIITKDSESWDDIAIPAYVPNDLDNVVCAYHLALIRKKSSKIISEFLYSAFLSQYISIQYKVKAKGVTRYGLSYQSIRDVIVFVPPLNEQVEIIKIIKATMSNIDRTVLKAQQEIDLITEYRTRLISDVVTGKVDVRNIIIDDTKNEDLDIDELDDEEVDSEADMDMGESEE